MSARPILTFYKKVVSWGLTPNTINFAPTGSMGHRVVLNVPVSVMNNYFTWTRSVGESTATGRFTNDVSGVPSFYSTLLNAFGTAYTDLDAVSGGLDFSSVTLDMLHDLKRNPAIYNIATDTGLVQSLPATGISTTHYGANDLVMAYLMFKCFNSSAYDPSEIIYNIDDAFNMLSSSEIATAIMNSLVAEDALANVLVLPNGKAPGNELPTDDKGRIDELFRMFLAKDPSRYISGGAPIPGLFDNNFQSDISGNWGLVAGDKIEIPLKFVFRAPVTVSSVPDTVTTVTTNIISGEVSTFNPDTDTADPANVLSIRLQLNCV